MRKWSAIVAGVVALAALAVAAARARRTADEQEGGLSARSGREGIYKRIFSALRHASRARAPGLNRPPPRDR